MFLIKVSRQLAYEQGILPELKRKKSGNKIRESHIEIVEAFYVSDDISRITNGVKDFMSVDLNGEKVPISKRLVLYPIDEVHRLFCNEHPTIKIGLSKFCALRQKWRLLPNASGTLNICVCIKHQNQNLMVCSTEREDCMLFQDDPTRRCGDCPDPDLLYDFLINSTDEEDVTYSQWVSTDRPDLVQITQHIIPFSS